MLCPTGHGTHDARLGRFQAASVIAAVPVVRIHALEIERSLDKAREYFVLGEIRCEALDIFEVFVGYLVLDLVPVLRALLSDCKDGRQ